MNQHLGGEFETFYSKGNYQTYPQKYNHQNRQSHHLDQEYLNITTIDNSNPKLDVTRIPAIKMVHS